jgi:hypothetical protein
MFSNPDKLVYQMVHSDTNWNLESHIEIASKGFCQHAYCLVRSSIINQYTCILTNIAEELILYRYEFKCNRNKIRKYFLAVPRYEPRSLGSMTDTLANSAMPPLSITLFLFASL